MLVYSWSTVDAPNNTLWTFSFFKHQAEIKEGQINLINCNQVWPLQIQHLLETVLVQVMQPRENGKWMLSYVN